VARDEDAGYRAVTRRRLIWSGVAALAAVILVGAALTVPRYLQERRARGAIVAYDIALTEAYANRDWRPMQAVARAREVDRVANFIDGFVLQGQGMRLQLLDLQVESLTSSGDTTTVSVTERWRIATFDEATKAQVGPTRDERQRVKYVLVSSDGGLVVDSARIVGVVSP
jgi:hypothetical protein